MYVFPAAVFQSVLIGGGYGTGRETVEYVTQAGGAGGVLSVLWFFVVLTVVLGASFEFARVFRTFDYRHFFKTLLGHAWWTYEVLAVLLLLLVLAVVISAAGTMALNWFGIPTLLTTGLVIGLTALVLYAGTNTVESVLSAWAILFSIFLVAITLFSLATSGAGLVEAADDWQRGPSVKGAQYALYNIAAIPLLLYTASSFANRREALIAALAAGVAGALPALLIHSVFTAHLPGILDEPLPMMVVIEGFERAWLTTVYAVLLIGIVVQTAIGVLEGVVQRLDGVRADNGELPFNKRGRALIGGCILAVSALGSGFGVIALIGQGYGTLAWGFMLVYALPIITVGVWKIRESARDRGGF